jgi:hypothetical protein
LYHEILETCAVLVKNPPTSHLQVATLYDLQARVCSNLERIYRQANNLHDARAYLVQGISHCETAQTLLKGSEAPELEQLHRDMTILRSKLEVRKLPYLEKSDEDSFQPGKP